MRSNWLLALFVLTAFCLYERGAHTLSCQMLKLQQTQEILERKIAGVEATKETLQREINSQSDPAWIELSLMKGLGLVPDGYTKIYIRDE